MQKRRTKASFVIDKTVVFTPSSLNSTQLEKIQHWLKEKYGQCGSYLLII